MNKVSSSSSNNSNTNEDPLNFLSKPHTIFALIVALIVTVYFAFQDEYQINSTKVGLLGAISAFLLFSMLQMRDGLFVRPHPAFWRIVMGVGVLYLCALVFLLFHSASDARALMKLLDPRLGVPLPERSYADNCDLYTPDHPTSKFANLMSTINDEFIWAHLFGWWGKTLLLRDSALCWVLSITFELLELTFQHYLPNFAECWWDHVILDILVCNALGIFLGLQTIKYLKMKQYNWGGQQPISGAGTQPSSQTSTTSQNSNIILRVAKQFTPYRFDEFHWEILSEWRRFVSVIMLTILISVIELNAFFLKTLLWIPPPNPLNIYRLLLWCLIGTPGLREYYQFATDKNTKRLGTMAWICIATIFVEVLICIKYGGAYFWSIPFPLEVKYTWIFGTILFTIASVYYFAVYKKSHPNKNSVSTSNKKQN
ncbi:phosphatidylserine synthase [Tieghemostelium lacteum]|uniref:Phosphatidylserine synthase n=1 Tax=Tieghemostelium lacteum TaxID=361077 RepID=A0A151ZKR6_TIELA|nr:phosphatidylserine synthase [Tieghemostelium lacteum]|eukprot:KYQ94384.1 phosphatidylserine synthase [Tieghemostelium lacteum]